MPHPNVSVLMAVRNGERWLSAACQSVLAQSHTDFELIVVDDGSSDSSPVILAELQAADGRVRVLRQDPRGLVGALNGALQVARAPLLARLDADDIALPARLSRQVSHMAAHADHVLLGTWAEKIAADGRAMGRIEPETEPESLSKLLLEVNPFIHSSVMMRADAVRAVGGYREAFAGAEDYDLWLRLAERGQIANLPEILIRYRWHGDGATQRHPIRQCFSARLAKESARSRRASGVDPAAQLHGPPDWWAPETAGRPDGDAARIYRFLDAPNIDPNDAGRLSRLQPLTPRDMAHLTHAERKLARRSLSHLLRSARLPAGVSRRTLVELLVVNLLARQWRRWTKR